MINVPVPVKDALKDGRLKKNYRFEVLADGDNEAFMIDNDTLVSESVNIDERMCSGDTLKFGLCEGSSLEFQYFNWPNITGRRIQAFVDVQYKENPWDEVGYIDQEAPSSGRTYEMTEAGSYMIYFAPDQRDEAAEVSVLRDGMYIGWYEITWYSDDHGEVELPNSEAADIVYIWGLNNKAKATVYKYVSDWYSIPMGFFDVAKCSRQASTGIIKVTAYNKLMSQYLDAKANDLLIEAYEDLDTRVTLGLLLDAVLADYTIDAFKPAQYRMESGIYTVTPAPLVTYTDPFVSVGGNTWLACHGFYFFVTDPSITLWPYDTLPPYTKIRIKGLDALKTAIKNQIGESIYQTYVPQSLDYFNLTLYTSTTKTQISLYNAPDEYESKIYYQLQGANQSYSIYPWYFHVALFFPADLITTDGNRPTIDEMGDAMHTAEGILNSLIASGDFSFEIVHQHSEDLDRIVVDSTIETWPDVTLRDLQTAVFESACQFGQLDRETDLFSGVELNHSRLYPAEDLYPATDLYPDGAAMSATRAMYSKLWADEGNVHKWRYLIITYKGLNEDDQEEDFTLQRTINADGTDDYNMSDNWLFRNLIWTAADVGAYADAMVPKMQDITWFPFEMWCAGLPYLETGDEIEIPLGDESYTSYILQRQLKGIQNLQDTYINGTLDIF